jgi:chemotaxis protein MotB
MAVHKPDPPIIIKKKKVIHGGHHGGAWKVAYADFVTAMMALFIVLWLMNSNEQVQKAVAGYFRDPQGDGKQSSSVPGLAEGSIAVGMEEMQRLKEKIAAAMGEVPQLEALKNQVEMTITPEGLRIELLEGDVGTFFESAVAEPTSNGTRMLAMLAAELGKIGNHLLIEGHTDARAYSGGSQYSNWELSTDRANAARRLMQQKGVRSGQVIEVRGCADQRPRRPKEPEHVSNRRVSIVVQYAPATGRPASPPKTAQTKPPHASPG